MEVLELLTKAVPWFAGSALFAGLLWRWLDRPRLRVHLRDEGTSRDGHELVFEVANGGGRPVAIHPVVVMRGFPISLLLFDVPPFLNRFHDRLPLALQPAVGRMIVWALRTRARWSAPGEVVYDLVEQGQELRLEAHAGSRTLRAVPRRPQEADRICYLRTLEIRMEGRRRRHRVRLVDIPPRRLSAPGYAFERLRFALRGLPPNRRGFDAAEWQASRRARG